MQVNGLPILNLSMCHAQDKKLDSKLEICAGQPIGLMELNENDKKIKDSCRVG